MVNGNEVKEEIKNLREDLNLNNKKKCKSIDNMTIELKKLNNILFKISKKM